VADLCGLVFDLVGDRAGLVKAKPQKVGLRCPLHSCGRPHSRCRSPLSRLRRASSVPRRLTGRLGSARHRDRAPLGLRAHWLARGHAEPRDVGARPVRHDHATSKTRLAPPPRRQQRPRSPQPPSRRQAASAQPSTYAAVIPGIPHGPDATPNAASTACCDARVPTLSRDGLVRLACTWSTDAASICSASSRRGRAHDLGRQATASRSVRHSARIFG